MSLAYPTPRVEEETEELHGVLVSDSYRWMEEIDADETQRWILAQNELTAAYLASLPDRPAIRQRMESLWNYEKFGVPRLRGDHFFFTRNDGLQNQSVLYILKTAGGEAQPLLDPNALSADGTVALASYEPNRDGTRVAYALSSAGSDWQIWRVRDVATGEDLPDLLEWVKFSSAAWRPDGDGFFYSRYAAPAAGETFRGANTNQQLFYHRMGDDQSQDRLIYARPDHKEWGFQAQISEDGRFLILRVWQGTHRENGLFYQDLSLPDSPVVELLGDFDAAYHFIGNDGERFYLLTDRDAPFSRVVAVDLDRSEPDAWLELIPETQDTLQQVTLVGDRFVALYLHDAYSRGAFFALDGSAVQEIDLPGLGTVMGMEGSRQNRESYYHFSSFTDPGTVYRLDGQSGDSLLFRRPQLPFDPDDFVTRQIFYPSRDGTQIPMFICHRQDLDPRQRPTFLYGYGGFNISLTPAFSVRSLVWMEMGGIYAQPNLRGGGEYGKAWHAAGSVLNKQTVFDDFIAAGEWLTAQGYTGPGQLAIGGGSNGGLLTAACMVQRPDLFGAVLTAVGVLDMLRFHKFTIGWAWTSDYGSPENLQEFQALLAYSPYHNLRPGTAYPPTIITTGDHDDRVFPAHSFKYGAALQAVQRGEAPILVRVETRAGHGAGKPTAKQIEETGDWLAFLAHHVGLKKIDTGVL